MSNEELFKANINLAYFICNKCCRKLPAWYVKNYKDDLEQQALIGLWSACEKYDDTYNNEFSTYAATCVDRSIRNYAEKHLRQRRGDDNPVAISLNTPVTDDMKLEDVIESKTISDVSWIFTDDRLTDLQIKVCKLKYEGYTDQEIGDMFGFCRAYPNKILKQVGRILNDDQ